MTLPFSTHESAELELNEAADFYDIENPGLGGVLIDEFERAVACASMSSVSSPWRIRGVGRSTGAAVVEVGVEQRVRR